LGLLLRLPELGLRFRRLLERLGKLLLPGGGFLHLSRSRLLWKLILQVLQRLGRLL